MKLFVLIIISLSLNSKTFGQKTTDSLSNKIRIEIPTEENGRLVSLYYTTKTYNRLLKLDSLEKGYDSIQIRIWCNYGLLKRRHLVVMSSQKGKWTGKLYVLMINRKNDKEYFIESNEEKYAVPKSGWGDLIRIMNSLNIPGLVSCDYLTGYGFGVDTDYYMVEIGTKNKYRFYDYFDPKSNSKEYKEAKAIEKFLSVLESEFSFTRSR